MKEEILRIANEVLTEDEINGIVKEKFKKAVSDACESAFRWGDIKDTIEKKIKEAMVPYIESYDFSKFIPKLDTVLTDIVNSDNCIGEKKILENFRELMIEPEYKEIKLTDIFKAWIKQCEKEINTDGLEVSYDDEISYYPVECTMNLEIDEERTWSLFTHAIVTFENEHDEDLNYAFKINKYESKYGKKEEYKLFIKNDINISALRRLNDFELLLLRLERANTDIIIDKEYDDSEIFPEKEPEASFS